MSDRYRVEVGVERTGVITVDAEDEQEARQKARELAERGANLSFTHSFTNNVRPLHTGSDLREEGVGRNDD